AYLVASGSLPPGVPADVYALLARMARDRGVRLVLDASGEALRLAGREGVFLWKPSLRELELLAGVSGVDEARLDGLARELVRAGACELLVLSLGSGGALWMTKDDGGRIAAPAVPYASGVGAGDSMVAGMVHRLLGGGTFAEVARYGVAAASASVMNPGTALCQPTEVERLYAAMQR
ncbi:MAG: 1-phosphofructokinase family hexose kinase, partial [Syntrophomonadaceae bacterium]